ncbi:ribonuclease HII [Planococcus sp. CP5-4]|uniref:ribonuclease HII n=1 Tax=unclassified Planococcus (in: firmicutes) TaxID=2662419 RepID=UPI001C231FC7|nr:MULTISPECIES: ribonuclease HII [unclassified Planococcus (in: firmicutes)]MBU9672087.1 ribonuclease HII [Planococcus sp. CP5-4_YE]MBV0907650.1 ribonuclease HII [Planococcus sp. CP5-4_UN]MBW6062817.1 ribonuclease HII [Planococcus sp. CP5-4]
METTASIKEKLLQAETFQPWMEELKSDSRKSVQQLLASWHRRYDKRLVMLRKLEEKQDFDRQFKQQIDSLVCGIDEAGRGPLAGPVVTAAVILPEDCSAFIGLDDSKIIAKAKRNELALLIKEQAISWSVHIQPPEAIDRLNIYQATKQSMEAAANSLAAAPDVVLADAMKLTVPMPSEAIIKGDAKSLCIAAASILAKTRRDDLMDEYAGLYPQYGFSKHSGYGTKDHLAALEAHGPCPIHRKTFEPVKSMVQK